jgi:hypothetical protein
MRGRVSFQRRDGGKSLENLGTKGLNRKDTSPGGTVILKGGAPKTENPDFGEQRAIRRVSIVLHPGLNRTRSAAGVKCKERTGIKKNRIL